MKKTKRTVNKKIPNKLARRTNQRILFKSILILLLVLFVGSVSFFLHKSKVKVLSLTAESAEYIYVSTQGNDNWSGGLAQPNASFTDGPLATLEKAKQMVRTFQPLSKDVYIIVRGGTYNLTDTLQLNSLDSGTADHKIIYMAYPGEEIKISGGKKIEGWSQYNSNIYVAHIPEVANGQWNFNSLFVNDERAIRSREPDTGYYRVAGVDNSTRYNAFTFNPGEIDEDWSHLNDVEIVSLMVWVQSRQRIDHIENGNKVYVESDSYYPFDYMPGYTRYYVENLFEGLDTPGEWYLDKEAGDLYYWPKDGEDINNTDIVAPVVNQLVSVESSSYMNLPGSFTVSQWIKTSASGTTYTIGNTAPVNPGYGNAPSHGAVGKDGYRLGFHQGGGVEYLIGNDDIRYSSGSCGHTVINDGQWHHIAGVFDRDNKKFICYVDGTSEGEVAIDQPYIGMNQQFPMIGQLSSDLAFYDGLVDETKIYSKVLSSADITKLFSLQDSEVTDGLQLSLSFEDNLADFSGQGRNAVGYGDFDYVSGRSGKALELSSADEMAKVEINDSQLIQNVHFKGFTFTFTDWILPEKGYADFFAGNSIPGPPAVKYNFTKGCSLENNNFIHTGSDAFWGAKSKNMSVTDNHFSEIGGIGIKIGEKYNLDDITKNNTIFNNEITDVGNIYVESPGLCVLLSGYNNISHNFIHDVPYSGMVVGWDWSGQDTVCKENIIEYNKVQNAMQELNDGAGIYVEGKQEGTQIRNNVIHDILATSAHAYSGSIQGIYLDQGSKDILIKNNLVYRISQSAFMLHQSINNILENNIFVDSKMTGLHLAGALMPDYYLDIIPTGNQMSKNLLYFSSQNKVDFASTVQNHSVTSSDYNLLYYQGSNGVVGAENIYPFDLDNNGQEDLVVDYGYEGLFFYYNKTNAKRATTDNAEIITSADVDHNGQKDLIVDFGAIGLWVFYNNTTWTRITVSDVQAIETGDIDGNGQTDVVVDTGSGGIWVYYNNTTWTKIGTSDPQIIRVGDLDNSGKAEIIASYGASQTYVYSNNTSWTNLTANNTQAMEVADLDGNSQLDLVADFGSQGLWGYYNKTSWSKISDDDAQQIKIGDLDNSNQDDVIVKLSNGLFIYYNNATLTEIKKDGNSIASFDQLLVKDLDQDSKDDLIVDFGSAGLASFTNNSTWQTITSTGTNLFDVLDVDNDDDLDVIGDFGSDQLLSYYHKEGSSWESDLFEGSVSNENTLENLPWRRWKFYGFDRHSVMQDPQFVNYAQDNFHLEEDSPAYDLGFVAFDYENAGLQSSDADAAPTIGFGSPTGSLAANTNQVTLSVQTDKQASCKYSLNPALNFDSMENEFDITGVQYHSTVINSLQNNHIYNFYVKCQDHSGNKNSSNYTVSFNVLADPTQIQDSYVPSISNEKGRVNLESSPTYYQRSSTLRFEGQKSELPGGSVRVYRKGKRKPIAKAQLDGQGNWHAAKHGSANKLYRYRFAYYNYAGTKVYSTSYYKVKIDTKRPLIYTKSSIKTYTNRQIRIQARDNSSIVEYTYKLYFNNSLVQSSSPYFTVPADLPAGTHLFTVWVKDSAGNIKSKNIKLKI